MRGRIGAGERRVGDGKLLEEEVCVVCEKSFH